MLESRIDSSNLGDSLIGDVFVLMVRERKEREETERGNREDKKYIIYMYMYAYMYIIY